MSPREGTPSAPSAPSTGSAAGAARGGGTASGVGRRPTPDPGTVHVWRIRLDASPVDRLLPLLDGRERRRAAGFVLEQARRRYVAAHGAVRLILGELLSTSPGALRWRVGAYGKPELVGRPGLETNLSHSGGLALLAVTSGRAVGVDVEEVRPAFDAVAFATRFFPAEESALVGSRGRGHARGGTRASEPASGGEPPADPAVVFARLWTRKEACVKAAGGRLAQGLRLPVAGIGPAHGPGCDGAVRGETGWAGAEGRRLATPWLVADPTGSLPGRWLVGDVEVPSGFAASVAAAGAEPYEIVTHDHGHDHDHDHDHGPRGREPRRP
ncbi:4'-phosphopantetheinyl transferase family protein [Streptosporangium sp. NPDC004631]